MPRSICMAGQNLLDDGSGGAAFIGMCAVAVQVSAESARTWQLGRLKKRAVGRVLGGLLLGTHTLL